MTKNRLITIPMSHYCEKARWGLEWAGIPYQEEKHLQGFHYLAVYRAAKTKTAPVLVASEGIFSDSTDILKWCNSKISSGRKLYPSDPELKREVEELVEVFDAQLGVAGRLWMYTFMLREIPLLLRYSKLHGIPGYQVKLMPWIFPLIRSRIHRTLKLTPASRDESKEIVDRVFDFVAGKLSNGGNFLVGDSFTAADLTFAALSSAVLLSEEYGVKLPSLEELPTDMHQQIQRWRQHPAGQFAKRIYLEYRLTQPAYPGHQTIKSGR